MRRPSLTERIVRGLGTVAHAIENTSVADGEAEDAVVYLMRLCRWYDTKQAKKENQMKATNDDNTINIDLPTRDRGNYEIRVYEDINANLRWRMKDTRNNEIIAGGTEGFSGIRPCVINCYLSTGFVPDGWTFSGGFVSREDSHL